MPIHIAGSEFEYPRRKATTALDEFCDAITAARSSSTKATPIEHRDVVHIDGASVDIVVVLQREAGAVNGQQKHAAVSSSGGAIKNSNSDDAAAASPSAPPPAPKRIASIDATTCLILSFENAATGDVSLAHLDSDKQVDSGVELLLRLANVRCQSAAASQKTSSSSGALVTEVFDDDDDAENNANNNKSNTKSKNSPAVVRVRMLGAVRYHEYSADLLSKLIKRLTFISDVVFDFGSGLDIAVWNLNTDPETGKCLRRGLMVDASTGEAFCVECQNQLRGYPDGKLRALRSFAKDQNLSAITLMRGEEIAVRIKEAPKNNDTTTSTTGSGDANKNEQKVSSATTKKEKEEQQGQTNEKTNSSSSSSAAAAEHFCSIFKLVVRPFVWPNFVPNAASQSLDFFYKLSSTPTMEPEDFASTLKAAVVYGNVFGVQDVFAGGKPRVFVRSDEAKWAQL